VPDQHLSELLLGHSSYCGMLSMEEEFQYGLDLGVACPHCILRMEYKVHSGLELGLAYPHSKFEQQHWPENMVENILRNFFTCMRKENVK
jgi:mannitol/fructose-specific phosphotransferase system IIA component (Ntr-type)